MMVITNSLSVQASGPSRLAGTHRTLFVADIFLDVVLAKVSLLKDEFNRMVEEYETGNLDIIFAKGVSFFS